jgi:formate dehydrogenase subunit delta
MTSGGSTTSTDKLVHMANQIGQFFAAMPDADEARADVARHLRRYWAPTMRQELQAAVATGQAAGLMPLVREALVLLSEPA